MWLLRVFSVHFNLKTDLWQLINFLLEAGAAQAVGRQSRQGLVVVTAVSDRQTQETIAASKG